MPSLTSDNRASSRFVWPPTIYGLATGISAALTWLMPARFLAAPTARVALFVGIAIILAGLLIVLAAGRLFKRAGTPVAPTKPSMALVTDGIYGSIRNPMYLSLTLVLLGIGIATVSIWFLIALPIAVFAVTKLAIEPEERYLTEKFGAAYLEYKTRVRRWGMI